jgi:hypothetical protein
VKRSKLIGGAAGLADCTIHDHLLFSALVADNIGDPASTFGISVRVEDTSGPKWRVKRRLTFR